MSLSTPGSGGGRRTIWGLVPFQQLSTLEPGHGNKHLTDLLVRLSPLCQLPSPWLPRLGNTALIVREPSQLTDPVLDERKMNTHCSPCVHKSLPSPPASCACNLPSGRAADLLPTQPWTTKPNLTHTFRSRRMSDLPRSPPPNSPGAIL